MQSEGRDPVRATLLARSMSVGEKVWPPLSCVKCQGQYKARGAQGRKCDGHDNSARIHCPHAPALTLRRADSMAMHRCAPAAALALGDPLRVALPSPEWQHSTG